MEKQYAIKMNLAGMQIPVSIVKDKEFAELLVGPRSLDSNLYIEPIENEETLRSYESFIERFSGDLITQRIRYSARAAELAQDTNQ